MEPGYNLFAVSANVEKIHTTCISLENLKANVLKNVALYSGLI